MRLIKKLKKARLKRAFERELRFRGKKPQGLCALRFALKRAFNNTDPNSWRTKLVIKLEEIIQVQSYPVCLLINCWIFNSLCRFHYVAMKPTNKNRNLESNFKIFFSLIFLLFFHNVLNNQMRVSRN